LTQLCVHEGAEEWLRYLSVYAAHWLTAMPVDDKHELCISEVLPMQSKNRTSLETTETTAGDSPKHSALSAPVYHKLRHT